MHEASLYSKNCFITLTYAPEYLPPDGGLIKKHFKDFMKRLRKKYVKKNPYDRENQREEYKQWMDENGIRYYMCGEYGDENNRPHYHAVLFNHDFNDRIFLRNSSSGYPLYTSLELEKLWSMGFVTVQDFTIETAEYVAGYVMKKINGPMADQINPETGLKHYERFNSFTGEITSVVPEYSAMSRGGRTGRGIGHGWYTRYKGDCYPHDYTVHNGKKLKVPKAYDRYLEEDEPIKHEEVKQKREMNMLENMEERSKGRLEQKEKVAVAKNSIKSRKVQ